MLQSSAPPLLVVIIFGIRTEEVFSNMWTIPLIYLSVAKDALRSVE